MDFYDVINARRTIRDFEETVIDMPTVKRILAAGMKAPTNDHLRNWHFIVLNDREKINSLIQQIPEKVSMDQVNNIMKEWELKDACQRKMYSDAIPKQYQMLSNAGCVIIPVFQQKTDLLEPQNLSALNAFASIWCCIENIFLAVTAEKYAYALRIPLGNEREYVKNILHFPDNYVMPCYIAIGKPAVDAAYVEQKEYIIDERIHLNEW